MDPEVVSIRNTFAGPKCDGHLTQAYTRIYYCSHIHDDGWYWSVRLISFPEEKRLRYESGYGKTHAESEESIRKQLEEWEAENSTQTSLLEAL